jgi:hypothetical protein
MSVKPLCAAVRIAAAGRGTVQRLSAAQCLIEVTGSKIETAR